MRLSVLTIERALTSDVTFATHNELHFIYILRLLRILTELVTRREEVTLLIVKLF